MKYIVKHWLSRHGLLPKIDLVRRLPEIISWLRCGSQGLAPPPVKRMVLSSYITAYGLKHFVETGTHLGDTLAYICHDATIEGISVELDDGYSKAAKDRFAAYQNVTVLHGDSGALMPSIIERLKYPALFWLDGHYSGADTAKGELETAASAELQAILQSPISGHVILIDDARCFDGSHDYPHLDELLTIVRASNRYHAEVSTDIIRITPKHVVSSESKNGC